MQPFAVTLGTNLSCQPFTRHSSRKSRIRPSLFARSWSGQTWHLMSGSIRAIFHGLIPSSPSYSSRTTSKSRIWLRQHARTRGRGSFGWGQCSAPTILRTQLSHWSCYSYPTSQHWNFSRRHQWASTQPLFSPKRLSYNNVIYEHRIATFNTFK